MYVLIFLGKPDGKRPLGRPKSRFDDNIKMNLREIGWEGMDFINVARDRGHWKVGVNRVIKRWEHFWVAVAAGVFSRSARLREVN
jgi:hypothetical protein